MSNSSVYLLLTVLTVFFILFNGTANYFLKNNLTPVKRDN